MREGGTQLVEGGAWWSGKGTVAVLCKAGAAAGRKGNDDGLASHKKGTTSRRARGRPGRRQRNCQLASRMCAGRAASACVGACS
jgi:hypothetical protein